MNSKLLAPSHWRFVAVVGLSPADEADAVSATVEGTVDSTITFGDGDVATVGESVSFTENGRLVMGSGSTLVIGESADVTGSGTIIEFQPGSRPRVHGSSSSA